MWNIKLCHHIICCVRSDTSRIWKRVCCIRYSHRSHSEDGNPKSVRYTLNNSEAEKVAEIINKHRMYRDGVLIEINAGHGRLTKALVQYVEKNYWCLERRDFLPNLKEILASRFSGHNMVASNLNVLKRNADIEAEEKLLSTVDLKDVPMTMVGVLHHTKVSGKPFMLSLIKRLCLHEGFFHLRPSEFFFICDPELVRLWLTSVSPDHQSTKVGLQMELFFDINILHKIPLGCFQPSYPVRKKFRKIIIDGEELTGDYVYLLHMVSQPYYDDLSALDFLFFSNFTKDSYRIGKQEIVKRMESMLPGSEAALVNYGFKCDQTYKMLSAQQLFHIYKIVTSLPGYERSMLQHILEDSLGCHSYLHNISEHLMSEHSKQLLLPAKTSSGEAASAIELPLCTEMMPSHIEEISTTDFKQNEEMTSQQIDNLLEILPCDTKSVRAREKELLCDTKSVTAREKELLCDTKSVTAREKELPCDTKSVTAREKELLCDTKSVRAREKELLCDTKSVTAREKELLCDTKSVTAREKELPCDTKSVTAREKELLCDTKSVTAREKELLCDTKSVTAREKELLCDTKSVTAREKELLCDTKSVTAREKELLCDTKSVTAREKELLCDTKSVTAREKELLCDTKSVTAREKELLCDTKSVTAREKELPCDTKSVTAREKELLCDTKSVTAREKELLCDTKSVTAREKELLCDTKSVTAREKELLCDTKSVTAREKELLCDTKSVTAREKELLCDTKSVTAREKELLCDTKSVRAREKELLCDTKSVTAREKELLCDTKSVIDREKESLYFLHENYSTPLDNCSDEATFKVASKEKKTLSNEKKFLLQNTSTGQNQLVRLLNQLLCG